MTGTDRLFISLYTDEDITDRLAILLRTRGFQASNVFAAGLVGLSDEEQLAFATSRGWTILTYNRNDFLQLTQRWLDAGREHAGVIISRQFSTRETGELLRQVCNLVNAVPADEMWNTVRYLQSYR